MNANKRGVVVFGFFLFCFFQNLNFEKATAQEKKTDNTTSELQTSQSPQPPSKAFHSALGEGQTLPSGIARFRYLFKSINAHQGFDHQSKPVDHGIDLHVQASALVSEYGITDKLTLQLMVPYIQKNSAGLNGKAFRKSAIYQEKYQKALRTLIAKIDGTVCSGFEQCKNLIDSGFKAPHDFLLTLPETGEQLMINSKTEIKAYIDSIILNQAAPAQGGTGLGDVEIGSLYNFYRNDRFIFSAGLGVRVPTGSFASVAQAYRPTGSGLYDLGLRVNLDYQPVYGLWLSIQEQEELALSSTYKEKTSLIDNTLLTPAENKVHYEQKGVRRKGFAGASFGLGVMHEHLKAFAVNSGISFRHERAEYFDYQRENSPSRLTSFYMGGSVDGRGYQLPMALELAYDKPIQGKNAFLAPEVLTFTLKAYAKF